MIGFIKNSYEIKSKTKQKERDNEIIKLFKVFVNTFFITAQD
jgi:hypothetical protein